LGVDVDEIEPAALCAICGEPEKASNKGRLTVDHDHDTNKFRGFLCHLCNAGLGQFRERIHLLHKAADYLASHSSVPSEYDFDGKA